MYGDYELWRYPAVRVRRARRVPLYGLGVDEPVATPAPVQVTNVDRRLADIGKGLFIGTAYGIAFGMILSEFVMRQKSAEAQLKQNHKLVLLGSLFGASVGAMGAVQKQAMQV